MGDDGAIPSGNSIAMMNLVRLYFLTDQQDYRKRAEKSIKCLSEQLLKQPQAMPGFILAMDSF